jgi:hypothetical protein
MKLKEKYVIYLLSVDLFVLMAVLIIAFAFYLYAEGLSIYMLKAVKIHRERVAEGKRLSI